MYKQEIIKLKEELENNGYPMQFIDDVLEIFAGYSRDCPTEKLNTSDFKHHESTLRRQTKYGIQKEVRKINNKIFKIFKSFLQRPKWVIISVISIKHLMN